MDNRMSQLPSWLWTASNVLPPIYRTVWDGVREDTPNLGIAQGELLVDTNKVFPLLLTSRLPTEVLGYIWSLANLKYAGQLTEQELYVVLALVAIAQASYTFNNLDVLHLMPSPPIPNLNISVLDKSRCIPQLQQESNSQDSLKPVADVNSGPSDGRRCFQARAESKTQTGLTPGTGINSASSDEAKLDIKIQSLPRSVDFNDEFSDFQSAPAPASSVPSIPVLDPKQGSAIGSRLANHSLGVSRPNEQVKKVYTNKNAHINLPPDTATGLNTAAPHTKDILSTDRLTELFPKCMVKNQAKTVILKDTAIRNNDPPKENVSCKDSTKFINKTINRLEIGIPGMTSCADNVKPIKVLETDLGQQDLMSVQAVEDRYSALRVLIEDPPLSVASNLTPASAIPPLDDFGDFVSAEQPHPSFSTSAGENCSATVDFFTDFELKDSAINVDGRAQSSLVQEISNAFNNFKIGNTTPPTLDEKIEVTTETPFHKEDTVSVNSIEIGNGAMGGLVRSGSVPSLDLKSFLPVSQDDDQQAENMHQLIYWEWKQYMESCVLLLQMAANIFTSIKSEAVLQEVLSTAQGYNFLCDLAEVAAVCRRVNFSHKEMDINIMGFDDLLMDIDRIWADMEPFYANIPIVTELPAWPLHQGESTICSLCLTMVTSGRVVYNDNSYHVTCANLWLNCVNGNLPAFCLPLQPLNTVPLTNSHV